MKISLWNLKHVKTDSIIRCTLCRLLQCTVPVLTPLVVAAADSFQLNALHNPRNTVLQTEARGRVMIYDGLNEAHVDRELGEQFECFGHMIFSHTRKTGPDGTVSSTDDGCLLGIS